MVRVSTSQATVKIQPCCATGCYCHPCRPASSSQVPWKPRACRGLMHHTRGRFTVNLGLGPLQLLCELGDLGLAIRSTAYLDTLLQCGTSLCVAFNSGQYSSYHRAYTHLYLQDSIDTNRTRARARTHDGPSSASNTWNTVYAQTGLTAKSVTISLPCPLQR